MKIFINENDRQNSRSFILKKIVKRFRIEISEFESNENLKKMIDTFFNSNGVNLTQLIDNYFKAYDDWFNFYQNFKLNKDTHQLEEYELTYEEKQNLHVLIFKRQETLKILEETFEKLQSV